MIGSVGARWSSAWAINGVVQTSDAGGQDTVAAMGELGARLVDEVEPVLFRWVEGGQTLSRAAGAPAGEEPANGSQPRDSAPLEARPRPGRRLHAGVMAQDLKPALDAEDTDFAAWGLKDANDPGSRQWVRPDQLVYVLWAALSQTRAELAALRAATG